MSTPPPAPAPFPFSLPICLPPRDVQRRYSRRSHLELLEVLLEVRLGRLRSRADSHGEVLEVVSARTRLEQVRPRLVIRRDQHAHPIRPPDVALSGPLVHVRQV